MIYIPSLGDSLVLDKDWEFRLYLERRNQKMLNAFSHELPQAWDDRFHTVKDTNGNLVSYEMKYVIAVVPKGTRLILDRLYIRSGNSDFDSATFRTSLVGVKGKQRFWAKLEDVNKIIGSWEEK